MAVPERLRWAVEVLEIRPGDQILELGCGPGAAVELVCERLDGGRITAIDRSPTAIERARRRNAEQVEAGRARFVCLEVAAAGSLGSRFDKVFAVNVNLFWTRRPDAELEVVKALLRRGAGLHLVFETPPGGGADRAARAVVAALTDHGFAATTASRSESLICVCARLPP
jgi:cyclopropane fatty-acyl-phospholipid synthase-like methyltransferase